MRRYGVRRSNTRKMCSRKEKKRGRWSVPVRGSAEKFSACFLPRLPSSSKRKKPEARKEEANFNQERRQEGMAGEGRKNSGMGRTKDEKKNGGGKRGKRE